MGKHEDADLILKLYDLRREATMREAHLCAREGITINIFLLQSWN